MTCRLCGEAKAPEELVVSIWDTKQDLTIKQFIEYYCFQELDPCRSLPQLCCQTCFRKINKFAAFSYHVRENQKKLVKQVDPSEKNDFEAEAQGATHESDSSLVVIDNEEQTPASESQEPSSETQNEPAPGRQNDPVTGTKKDPAPVTSASEPEMQNNSARAKKASRTDRGKRWIILPPKNTNEPEPSAVCAEFERRIRNVSRKVYRDGCTIHYHDMKRKQGEGSRTPETSPDKPDVGASEVQTTAEESSVSEPTSESSHEHKQLETILLNNEPLSDSAFVRNLKEIDSFYTGMDLTTCSMIAIETAYLLSEGEVPQAWLNQYEDYKIWSDFNFACDECSLVFKNLVDFTSHLLHSHDQAIAGSDNENKIDRHEYFPSYINGMASKIPLLKFCCVVCSKSFVNMPYLSSHYQRKHPHLSFLIFPCLECGHYSSSMFDLMQHKMIHFA